MARDLTFTVGDTVWICSNNTKKSAVGLISSMGQTSDGNVVAEVVLMPDCDYYDWDLQNALVKYEQREVTLPLYRLEPIKW